MLAIRMRRLGAKKRPFFRIVVIDSHAARDGRALEVIGHYNPTTEPESFDLDRERLNYWTTRGAQPSSTVRTLLKRQMAGAVLSSSSAETSEVVAEVAPESSSSLGGVSESESVNQASDS
tara:strand:+ start:1952 stop:2311 length:360 start_codon:yes stop_codon:yes gene_type:complete